MDKNLSEKLADVLTLDIIELIGDEACMAVLKMQNDNISDDKIIDYIQRRLADVSGKLVGEDFGIVLDKIRSTTKYQVDMNILKREVRTGLPVRIARNKCFDIVGLHGFSMMDDLEVSSNLYKSRDIRLIAKALAVRDFLERTYTISLPIIPAGKQPSQEK